MSTARRTLRRLLAGAALAAACAAGCAAGRDTAPDRPEPGAFVRLLGPADSGGAPGRIVEVLAPFGDVRRGDRVEIERQPGERMRGLVAYVSEGRGRRSVSGDLEGGRHFYVQRRDGRISGTLDLGAAGAEALVPRPGGTAELVLLPTAGDGFCGNGAPPGRWRPEAAPARPDPGRARAPWDRWEAMLERHERVGQATALPTRIRVGFLLTKAAQAYADERSLAVEDLLGEAVDAANECLTNSRVDVVVEGAGPWPLEESWDPGADSVTKAWNTLNVSGSVRERARIDAYRETHAADIACVVAGPGGDVAGIANLLGGYCRSDVAALSRRGWFIVRVDALRNTNPGLTFPHEFGHVLGCSHQRDDVELLGCYCSSYGWRFEDASGNAYQTVECSVSGERETLRMYSNPKVLVGGTAAGEPSDGACGGSSPCWPGTTGADAAATIELNAGIASKFR